MSPADAGLARARARLCPAIGVGMLCALSIAVLLDPGAFAAASVAASGFCSPAVVTNTLDSGPGSLRDEVACAAPGDTVTFDPALAGQTIVLTTTEIAVAQADLTIDGSAALGVQVDGNSAHRVFHASAPLTIIALTIQNGSSAFGGGLQSSSDVTLTGVSFLTNTASSTGGGASVVGAAALNGGLFQNNSSTSAAGGGLYAGATLVLTGTQFLGNRAFAQGGGASVVGAAALDGGLFQNNSSTNDAGGGLYAGSSLVLTDMQFFSNRAINAGGGAYLAGAGTLNGGLFQSNTSGNVGGGLYAGIPLVLTGTQFLSNTAPFGGGAYTDGAAALNGALFQNNRCTLAGCHNGGWYAGSSLILTQLITTADDIQNDGPASQAPDSVILFNGSSQQTIAGAGQTTFNAMWVANTGAGLWLGQDLTVTNRLTLSTDLTTTSSYMLNLTANASSAGMGDVWGTTYRGHAFVAGVTYPFGNPNVSVDFTSGTPPSEMTVDLTHTVPAGANFGIAVKRYYDISQAGASGFTATLRLHYQDGELNGNTEGALLLWHYPDGGPWTSFPATAFDPALNWVESDAATDFSPWAISQNAPGVPTAVSIAYFGAVRGAGQITLTWVTALDLRNFGFNLERSPDGRTWTPLAFVPGQSPCVSSSSASSYTFVDKGLPANTHYTYRLQFVGQPCGGRNTYYDRTTDATTSAGALVRRLYLPLIAH